MYVQAINKKLQPWSNRKPAPFYVEVVLRCFENFAIFCQQLYIPTYNWSKLLSPRQLRVEVGADLHLDNQGNIFCNKLYENKLLWNI